MTSDVTANIGQIVTNAVEQLNAIDSVIGTDGWIPTFSDSYDYASSVATRIDSFLAEVALSNTCNAKITYITEYNGGGGSSGFDSGGSSGFGSGGSSGFDSGNSGNDDDNGNGDAFILSFADNAKLDNLISKLEGVKVPAPASTIKTDIRMPRLSQIPLPSLLSLPTPPAVATIKELGPTYQDSYLTAIMSYVENIVSGNLPSGIYEILDTEAERLEYDLAYALQAALTDTASHKFRMPNSRTLYNQRTVYENYFKAIESSCKEFTDAVQSLFLDAHKLGVSVEQLEMDFTRHINNLAIALVENEISAYEQKIAVSVDVYNAAIAKASAALAEPMAQVQSSMLQVKALILGLSAVATNSTLAADHNNRLVKFAETYTRTNADASKERLQKKQADQFERDSEIYKTLHDLDVETKEFQLESEVVKSNQQVLSDKLKILQNDLEAYSSLARISATDVEQSKAEWDRAKKEIALKLKGLEGLPKVMDATTHVVSAMLASDITLQKKTGSA